MRRVIALVLAVALVVPPAHPNPSTTPRACLSSRALAVPAVSFFHSGLGRPTRVTVIVALIAGFTAAQPAAKYIDGTDDLSKLAAPGNASSALVNRVLSDAHGVDGMIAAYPELQTVLTQHHITDPITKAKAVNVFIIARGLWVLSGLSIDKRAEGLETYIEQLIPSLNPKNPFNVIRLLELLGSSDKRRELFQTIASRVHQDTQNPNGDFRQTFVIGSLHQGMDPLMMDSLLVADIRQLGITSDLVMDSATHALMVRVPLNAAHTLYIDAQGIRAPGIQAVAPTADSVTGYLHHTIASHAIDYPNDIRYFFDTLGRDFSAVLFNNLASAFALPPERQKALHDLVEYDHPLAPQREDGNVLNRLIRAHIQRGPIAPEAAFQHVAELQTELADKQREIETLLNDPQVRLLEIDFDQSSASRALQERFGSLFPNLRKVAATLGDWSRNPLKIETELANRLPKGTARDILKKDIDKKMAPKKKAGLSAVFGVFAALFFGAPSLAQTIPAPPPASQAVPTLMTPTAVPSEAAHLADWLIALADWQAKTHPKRPPFNHIDAKTTGLDYVTPQVRQPLFRIQEDANGLRVAEPLDGAPMQIRWLDDATLHLEIPTGTYNITKTGNAFIVENLSANPVTLTFQFPALPSVAPQAFTFEQSVTLREALNALYEQAPENVRQTLFAPMAEGALNAQLKKGLYVLEDVGYKPGTEALLYTNLPMALDNYLAAGSYSIRHAPLPESKPFSNPPKASAPLRRSA